MKILGLLLSVMALLPTNAAGVENLRNDSWEPGDSAFFQGGFVADEIAAARLEPTGPCPCQVRSVTFLYGGAATQRLVTVVIWDDNGSTAPGAVLFGKEYLLTGSGDLQSIDLSAEGVLVDGPFRLGLRFTAAGPPAAATDDDATIDPNRNFALLDGVGWVTGVSAGLSGDWILRATVDAASSQSVRVDGFVPGDAAVFQEGFSAGEIAATRQITEFACPCYLDSVDLLYGGSTETRTITLKVWADSGGLAPGSQIHSSDLSIAGLPSIQRLDLSSLHLVVPQSFRIGILFLDSGLPSIARDDDGTLTADRNFLLLTGPGWTGSGTMGIAGDWILRGVVRSVQVFSDGFESGNTASWSAAVP